MGCTASRNIAIDRDRERFGSRRRLGKSSSFTPLRSASKQQNDMHYDYHVVALTSSTYGIMKLLESKEVNEHLVSVIGGGGDGQGYTKMRKSDSMPARDKQPKTWTDMAMGCSRFKLEQLRNQLEEDKKPLTQDRDSSPEQTETETINTWELMEGLDDFTPRASPLTTTTITTQDTAAEVLEKVTSTPKVRTLPRSRSLSAVDGLRVLNKAGIVPDIQLTMEATSTLLSNRSFDLSYSGSGALKSSGLPTGQVMGFPVNKSTHQQQHHHHSETVFPTISDGSLDEAVDSNLFDPDILATFADVGTDERTSSDEDWCHIRSSDGEASTSASTVDDDSPMQWARGGKQKKSTFDDKLTVADSQSGTYGPRKMSFAKVAPSDPIEQFEGKWVRDPLDEYEEKCPPGGEDRVVLYLTSLRGIRKTFEDCHSLKMILQSFAVWVDERDVSMHAEFRQELKHLTGGGPVPVPRVFIRGRYIGGSDEVRKLHEDGKLGDLLQDLPVVNFRKACDGCGGVRFVPCPECSGSCKVILEGNEVARCPDCNENGLIRCPVCF